MKTKNDYLVTLPIVEKTWLHEPGCGLATGWDAALIAGQHPCGKVMTINFHRWMSVPTNVTWEAKIDTPEHAYGVIRGVPMGEISRCFMPAWQFASSRQEDTKGNSVHAPILPMSEVHLVANQ